MLRSLSPSRFSLTRQSTSSSSSSSSSSDSSDSSSSDSSSSDESDDERPAKPIPPAYGHYVHGGVVYADDCDLERTLKRTNAIKLKHRSSLSLTDWQRYQYYSHFDQWRKQVYQSIVKPRVHQCYLHLFPFKASYAQPLMNTASEQPNKQPINNACECAFLIASSDQTVYQSPINPANYPLLINDSFPVSAGVDRIHEREFTNEAFIAIYEQPSIPCLIDGLTEDWPAKHWTFASLAASPYRNVMLKCGESDSGFSLKIKLKYFLSYMHQQSQIQDDSPLYVFDCAFDEDPIGRGILNEFSAPRFFRDDMFSLVGERRRPPYRWICIGPARSGSSLHIDPLATSAWNTLLRGMKLWVLFPPDCPRSIVKGDSLRQRGEDAESITYFMRVLPRIKQQDRERVRSGQASQLLGMREFIQYPGQTVFVPANWWHAVLNLEDSIAVTQNFCSRTNFPHVWRKTRTGRRKMAQAWLRKLYESPVFNPSASLAILLNEEDKFSWDQVDKTKAKVETTRKRSSEETSTTTSADADCADQTSKRKRET